MGGSSSNYIIMGNRKVIHEMSDLLPRKLAVLVEWKPLSMYTGLKAILQISYRGLNKEEVLIT